LLLYLLFTVPENHIFFSCSNMSNFISSGPESCYLIFCVSAYIHTYLSTYIQMCVCVCVTESMYVCIYVIYIYIYICVCELHVRIFSFFWKKFLTMVCFTYWRGFQENLHACVTINFGKNFRRSPNFKSPFTARAQEIN
jgi:hypothetical protein